MAQGQQPNYRVSYVKDDGRGNKRWVPVGAAWVHKDAKGFTLVIDAVPVNFNGELVLRPPYQEGEQPPGEPMS